MANLSVELEAYEGMRRELELDHLGKWVVVHDKKLVGIYESFQEAAGVAMERFGRGPYLIKQVGEGPIRLPAAALYRAN